jgi:PGDYG protein
MVPGAMRAQKTTIVQAMQIAEPFELVLEDGRVQRGNAGDWILQATKGDVYVVRDHVFQATYRITPSDVPADQ